MPQEISYGPYIDVENGKRFVLLDVLARKVHELFGDAPLLPGGDVAIARLIELHGADRGDLASQRLRPFAPGEQAALVQQQCGGERQRLPWLTKHWPTVVVRLAGKGGVLTGHAAGSR